MLFLPPLEIGRGSAYQVDRRVVDRAGAVGADDPDLAVVDDVGVKGDGRPVLGQAAEEADRPPPGGHGHGVLLGPARAVGDDDHVGPRPPVSSRTATTASMVSAAMAASGATRPAASSRRRRFSSTRSTRAAPLARARRTCRQPIGPAPTTTTVWPSPTRACSWPLITQLSGSATDASANDSPSGRRLTPSTASTLAGTRISSANPPS